MGFAIKTKRAYLPASAQDGKRFLVDRLWPRGMTKEKLKISGWVKEAAPSGELREWFGHDPKKWPEFQKRYKKELRTNQLSLAPILQAAQKGTITLLFGAKDTIHNNAECLKKYLALKLKKGK